MPAAGESTISFESRVNDLPKGFINEHLARERAFHFRYKALENLDKQLLDFESHFVKNKGKISWMPDAAEARQDLDRLLQNKKVHTHPHHLLEELNYTPQNAHFLSEDDLSSARVKPSESDAALLFPEFYVSENGALVMSQTDPYIGQLLAKCGTLVFLIGIEQVASTLSDTETLLALLKRYRNASTETGSYHITFGPHSAKEIGTQQEYHVVFLDNGRTNLLEQIPQRQALYCIHCGACAESSNLQKPNSKSIISAVKAPFMQPSESTWAATFKYPLSKRANFSCPVNIDLKQLLLTNRKMAVSQKTLGRSDNVSWAAWKKAMLSRKWLNQGSGLKQFTLKSFYKNSWGEQRAFPKIADKSFNQWWVESRGKSDS